MKKMGFKISAISLLIIILGCKNLFGSDEPEVFKVPEYTFFESKIKLDSTTIANFKDEKLKLFYEKFNNETIWEKKDVRAFILSEFQNSSNEGLNPEDYHLSELKISESQFDTLSEKHIVDYDIKITQNFQTYISHISKGKLVPTQIYGDWALAEKKIDVNQIVFDCFDKNNFQEIINNCKPKHPTYKKLIYCLKKLNELPNDTIKFIEFKGKNIDIKKGNLVRIVKTRLMFWGDLKKNDTITKDFDDETKDALKKFQDRHGLTPDGILGRGTVDALNYTKDNRIEQIVANLERWRWYASDFGKSYVLTNIADYTLVAVKNGDTTHVQKIVVGRETRRTPILESKISNINLNPNWTVPPTILKEDIYPDAIKDKGVFRKKGLTIYDSKNHEVNPWSWTMETASKYKYVQKPDRNNSLGLMKINFPNRYSVYMHDTNHRDFFSFNFRCLSSGCVRLERPLEMAEYILNDCDKWPLEKIKDTTDIKHYKDLIIKRENNRLKKESEKTKKELARQKKLNILPEELTPEEQLVKSETVSKRAEYIRNLVKNLELKTIVIPVKEDILIHQLYWTAWERNTILQFREDIYCLDQDLFAKLRYAKPEKKKL